MQHMYVYVVLRVEVVVREKGIFEVHFVWL